MFRKMKITGIILTGGKSRRMGSDKALLEIGGESLIDRAIELCRSICDEILVSSDLAEHERKGIRRIEDEQKHCGPMGGIYSCLKQSSNKWNFVWSVDAPFVEKDFIEFLNSQTPGFDAVVPVHGAKTEPLIAFYQKNTLPAFQRLLGEGNYKMHYLLEKISVNHVNAEDWLLRYPKLFHNLNHPEDLDLEHL